MNNNCISCDYKCPLHENCARFNEYLDKSKEFHFGTNPYKNGKCFYFSPITDDDIIDKVTKFLKPFNN
jgi:hypothetical protein